MSPHSEEKPGTTAAEAATTYLDGTDLGLLMAEGRLDARTTAARAIEQAESDCSFITVTADRARKEARAAHHRLSRHTPNSPLDGVPIAVKDLFHVEDTVTTAGSKFLARNAPESHDAELVDILTQAGAILVGKTNLSEFAFSGLGINPHYGTPRPPGPDGHLLIPGGSSSGSAVAVARNIVPIAIGTDTSGSIRIPAAFCGIIGYKASENRYTKKGMFSLSTTLDSVGILAHSMRDIIMTDRILRRTKLTSPQPPTTPPTIVVPIGELIDDCEPEVRENFDNTLTQLASHGHHIEYRTITTLQKAQHLMDHNTTIVSVEAHEKYGHLLHTELRDEIDPAIIRRLSNTVHHSSSPNPLYQHLIPLRQQLADELQNDVLACPTVRHTPPHLRTLQSNPQHQDHTNQRTLRTTMLLSYLGMPGISLPSHPTQRTAILFSTPADTDTHLLTTAHHLHQHLAHHN